MGKHQANIGLDMPTNPPICYPTGRSKKSAQRKYALTRGQDIARHAGPTIRELPPGDRARVCAELAFRYMKASVSGDSRSLAEVTDEFEKGACDPAWLTTIDEYLQYFGIGGQRQSIPYLRPADVGARTIELKSDARVALVGDWGTGARPAVEILKQIAAAEPDLLVHLGDIYYSGTPLECKRSTTCARTPAKGEVQ